MQRLFLLLVLFLFAQTVLAQKSILTGADQLDLVLASLKDKRVGLIINHTSIVGSANLADTLKARGVNLVKIFATEHGFRGNKGYGEEEDELSGIDQKTGLPIVSIYRSNEKKPKPEHLADLDVIVFDIQDVGARFFTYPSTMKYAMEACAENGKKMVVLDRPNPNGSYVDGPVLLDSSLYSFIGINPVPIAHGLTVGELAMMINGEGWLAGRIKCDLQVIPVKNWTHDDPYHLPVRPSPNLPNDQSVRWYPTLCLFEGTVISQGRGTEMPFQIIGHPLLKQLPFQFTPASITGVAINPPLEGQLCHGLDLRNISPPRKVDLKYLIEMYAIYPEKENFFNVRFDKLAGNKVLKEQIKQGMSEAQIRATWKKDLDVFKAKRKKYLLYK